MWAGFGQRRRSIGKVYGYKEIVPPTLGLPIDFTAGGVGAFTTSDITAYFALLHERVPGELALPVVTEEDAECILDLTQGVPLAVRIAAGPYLEQTDLATITARSDGTREIVDEMVQRYLLHTRDDQDERMRLYGLALLRHSDHPLAVAAALGLAAEQASTCYETELSRLQRRYSFIFTEKAQPSLHQEVRYFLRLWLLERRKEPEILAVNTRLKEAHEAALKDLEAIRQYSSLEERCQDEEWVSTYLDLTEQQFWLDPVEGVRYVLPFMIAAAIYRRDINEDAAAIGTFFQTQIRRPYLEWWTWAIQSLIYLRSYNPWQEELTGLEALVKLVEQHLLSFPHWLPDYRKELEAALWWRVGEAYNETDDLKAMTWYEKALERLEKHAVLRKDAAKVARNIDYKLYKEDKYREGLPFLDRAIELDPDHATAYFNRGLTYNELKEFRQAIQNYDRAIELDPNYAVAYFNRGLAHLWLKNMAQARVDFERNHELDATDIRSAWMAEWVNMSRQRIDVERAALLEAIAAIGPESYEARICRGIALGLSGKGKEGLEEMERAISRSPEEGDAYFWKGMLSAYYARLLSYSRSRESDRAIPLKRITSCPAHAPVLA